MDSGIYGLSHVLSENLPFYSAGQTVAPDCHLGKPELLCFPVCNSMGRLDYDVTAHPSPERGWAGAAVVAVTIRVAIGQCGSRWPDVFQLILVIQLTQLCLQTSLLLFKLSVVQVDLLKLLNSLCIVNLLMLHILLLLPLALPGQSTY